MWRNLYSLTSSRISWLIAQLIVLILCAAYIQYIYEINILPDKIAEEAFQRTQCFLISKKLSTQGRLVQRYRADFLISYNANGVQYNRWVSGNGLDKDFFRNEAAQEDILSQFEVGGTYPCRFNPEAPQQVLLVLRKNWYSTFPLIGPAVIGMIMLYYFLKNVFKIVDSILIKSRKRRQINPQRNNE